jgi:hypothetical protein
MDLVFAYGAGLLTLINPCVLPVLPIVLATALQASRWGPVALAAGMSLSFAILGVTVSAFGRAVGLNADDIAQVGAVLMILFGLVLLVPQASAVFSTATAGFAARADSGLDEVDRGSLTGNSWVACCWALYGALVLVRHWVVPYRWQAKAKVCCARLRSCSSSRLASPPSSSRLAKVHALLCKNAKPRCAGLPPLPARCWVQFSSPSV